LNTVLIFNPIAAGMQQIEGKPKMKNIQQLVKNLIEEESGQDLIEYALVAALVGLGSVASMSTLATTISNTFGNISSLLDSATS
jgi:pilus assembly protein Flp/PilA